jgi:NADPH-dependent 2,4-dienoyl-CoA reductase/sulfur reductase-like enzyme
VDLRAGTRVSEVVPGGVRLDDGSVIEADTVLVAVGSRPNIEWLTGKGDRAGRWTANDQAA